MYKELLKKVLSENEAAVYDYVLTQGPQTAAKLIDALGLSRGNVYYIIEKLEEFELLERYKIGRKTHFRALNPQALDKLLEYNQRELESVRKEVGTWMPNMISDFYTHSTAPGVTFFEDKDGFRKILYNTLHAKSDIYAYIDYSQITEFGEDINKEYYQKRIQKQVTKKNICVYQPEFTDAFIEHSKRDFSEVKLIEPERMTVPSSIQIYDDVVAFFEFGEEGTFFAFEVHSPGAAAFHKKQFEQLWEHLPDIETFLKQK